MPRPEGSSRAPLREQIACYVAFLSDVRCAAGAFDIPAARAEQAALARRFLAFLDVEARPFHRETRGGHVTGSACIASRDLTSLLLLRHAKLGKWLQPGGHSDGDSDTAGVALREAAEETGLASLVVVSPAAFFGDRNVPIFPLDLDVHGIPARGSEPAHVHWDVRYLVVPGNATGPSTPVPTRNHESLAIAWVELDEIGERTTEESVLRLGRKVAALARKG